jgi:hypothetical protein
VRSWALSILIALVAIFLITDSYPDLLVYALVFTFGLAFPLLFINSILLYFLAALPLLIVLHKTPRRWAAIFLAACAIPAVALLLPMLAETAARWKAERLRAEDVYARLSVVPKSIEIVGDWRFYTGRNELVADAPCEALCQRLLLSRRVDLVRVTRETATAVAPVRVPVRVFQLDYLLEQRGNCPSAFHESGTVLPQTLDAIASGICFVARPPDATSMAARIVIRKTRSREPAHIAADLAAATGKITETQVLEILTPKPAGWSRELRQTQVEFSYWRAPLHLTFAYCYGLCLGRPVFGRAKRMLHPFDPDELALHALGVERVEPQDRPKIRIGRRIGPRLV